MSGALILIPALLVLAAVVLLYVLDARPVDARQRRRKDW